MQPRPTPAQQVFADTETIPTQRLDILRELTEEHIEARDQALAAIAPPKNIKKAEAIAAWMENEAPAKREAILADYDTKLKEAIHKTCLDGAFGHLVVISVAAGEDEPINLWDSNWSAPGYEAWLLHELNAVMKGMTGHFRGQTLVGHNIKFDRNMIRQRGIVLGVPVHPMFSKEVKPWENDAVYDTMIAWTGDHRLYITMDKLCKALGIAGKGTDLDDGEYIDGSQVWEFVQRGEIAKVAKYCGGDVKRTRDIFKVLRGLAPRPPQPAFTPTPQGRGIVLAAGAVGVDLASGPDKTTVQRVEFAGNEPDDDLPPAVDEAPALGADEVHALHANTL